LSPITSYGIRDYEVQIYSISALTGNQQAGRYQPSAYERAIAYRNQEQYHQAFAEINSFLNYYPRSWSGNVLLVELLMRSNQFDRAAEVLSGLASRHPDDYSTNIIIARSYQVMGTRQNNSNWLNLSRRYYDKAGGDDPFKIKNARRIYEMTAEQLKAGVASPQSNP
jgi:predicted Zn-dependent protease